MTWEGDLLTGHGRVDSVSSGAFGGLEVDWHARTEDAQSKTSPEELIAAAHAACFAMALSSGLARDGHAAGRLNTSATVTFQPGEGITKVQLGVAGRVPGIDEGAFREAAEQAKQNYPVSKAPAGVPEIALSASLES